MLDQDVVNLTKAIRQQESGGKFDVKGGSGEFGAYQFMPDTWKGYASEVGITTPLEQASPVEQNKVAYTKIKSWKDAGYNVGQIASMWNAGPAKPNAYKEDWRGVNEFGVAYDTPAYAKAVATHYHTFKSQTPSASDSNANEEVSTPGAVKSFRYQVEQTPIDRASKIKQYQNEATAADEEAKKANSFTGMLKNFGKAFVENVAGSEVGLGKTIAEINFDPMQYADNINTLTSSNITLQKLIKQKEDAGQDATSLKKSYNSNSDLIDEWKSEIQGHLERLPSDSKAVGQMGGTMLDILTAGTYGKATVGMKPFEMTTKKGLTKAIATGGGLPELGKIAEMGKPTGLFTIPGVKKILKGAGIGYLYDVTQGMQGMRGEDREGMAAGIPGIGTLLGATISAIPEAAQSYKNNFTVDGRVQTLINQRQRELDKLDSYVTLKKTLEKGREKGINIKKILSTTDVLHGSVDNTGTIHTLGEGAAVEQYTKQFIDGNESIVSDLLKKEGRGIAPNIVKKALIKEINSAGIEGAALTRALKSVDDEMAGYMTRATEGGAIPVEVLHNAKVDKYNSINFFTEGNTKKLDKTIARTLRELVEKNTKSVDVAKINKELSKHFTVIDYLTKLDNKKVEGGRLGKYFASTIGSIIGHGAGGPLGGILGAEAGGRVKGGLMASTFNGRTGIVQPQSKVITNAKKVLKEKPMRLGAQSSNNLGNLNQSQSPTITNTKKGISPIINDSVGEIKKLQSSIKNHLNTAEIEVLNMSEPQIKKLGGLHKLIEQNRKDIVDQLFAEGFKDAAVKIEKLRLPSFDNVVEYTSAVRKIIKLLKP